MDSTGWSAESSVGHQVIPQLENSVRAMWRSGRGLGLPERNHGDGGTEAVKNVGEDASGPRMSTPEGRHPHNR